MTLTMSSREKLLRKDRLSEDDCEHKQEFNFNSYSCADDHLPCMYPSRIPSNVSIFSSQSPSNESVHSMVSTDTPLTLPSLFYTPPLKGIESHSVSFNGPPYPPHTPPSIPSLSLHVSESVPSITSTPLSMSSSFSSVSSSPVIPSIVIQPSRSASLPLHMSPKTRLLYKGEYGYVFHEIVDRIEIAIKQPKIILPLHASTELKRLLAFTQDPTMYCNSSQFLITHPSLSTFHLNQTLDLFTFDFLNECFILSNLKHRHIITPSFMRPIQLPDLHEHPKNSTLLTLSAPRIHMPLYPYTVESIITKQIYCSMEDRKRILFELLKALHYLHLQRVVHGDIKASNILLTKYMDVVLNDMGLSKILMDQKSQSTSPQTLYCIHNRPVELLLGSFEISTASDMWAFGCVMGELLRCDGSVPSFPFTSIFNFEELTSTSDVFSIPQSIQKQLLSIFSKLGTPTEHTLPGLKRMPLYNPSWTLYAPSKSYRSFLPDPLSSKALDLLSHLWDYDPVKRYTALQAMQHPFFSEYHNQIELGLSPHDIASWCKPIQCSTEVRKECNTHLSLEHIQQVCASEPWGESDQSCWKLAKRLFLRYVQEMHGHKKMPWDETKRKLLEEVSIFVSVKICKSVGMDKYKHVLPFQHQFLSCIKWQLC